LIFIACAVLSACSVNNDAEMWECQLAVQKDNAGRSAEAAPRPPPNGRAISPRAWRSAAFSSITADAIARKARWIRAVTAESA